MNIADFPEDIQPYLIPEPQSHLSYRCLGCRREYDIGKLLYTCPSCRQVLLIYDENFKRLKEISASTWHRIFSYRKMLNNPALKGIYRYHEFIGPILPLSAVVYLGEGHTPVVEANDFLQEKIGMKGIPRL